MAISSLTPGFRFHPTDTELVMYYLKRKLLGKKTIIKAIAEVNIYDFSPWDLPDLSLLQTGDLEWYFFCPKAKKYTSGSRANRATQCGFWKATGKDKNVTYKDRMVATRKTLVFHKGHAGKGQRTDWVMHEYKMEDRQWPNAEFSQDTYVICKIFEKSGSGPKNGAQYGAPFNEEMWDADALADADGATTVTQTEPGSPILTSPSVNDVFTIEPVTQTVTQTATLTEPASPILTNPSTVPVPANDVFTIEEIALMLGVSNNENQEREAQVVAPNEDDDIYDDLVKFIDLETGGGSEYTVNQILLAADDDDLLGDFFVD